MKTKSNPRRMIKQSGVVIVVALFIMALVTSMAYLMLSRLSRDTYRTTLLLRNAQAEYFAEGSIAWAIDQLSTNWKKKKTDKLVDNMPLVSPETNIQGYKIVSTIYDMQSRFNINNIADSKGFEEFQLLLQAVLPQLSRDARISLTYNINDWIYYPTGVDGELPKYYLNLPKPYRPAHRPMVSIHELSMVKGVTPEIYHALLPYIVALPEKELKINVRTAPWPVLATLSKDLVPAKAQLLEKLRNQKNIQSVKQFAELDPLKKANVNQEKMVVDSNYFLVETKVAIENQEVILYTLLQRTAEANDSAVHIVWQSKGVW